MIHHSIPEANMVARARGDLLAAGLAVFDRDGFERQLLPLLRIEKGTGRHAVPRSAAALSRGSARGDRHFLERAGGHRPFDSRASGLGYEQPARSALSV